MFTLDYHKLAACIRERQADRGVREAAEEIDGVSASTLWRLATKQATEVSMATFLAICDWLHVQPCEFFADDEAATYHVPDYNLQNEMAILINSSGLLPEYKRVLTAVIEAGIKVAQTL